MKSLRNIVSHFQNRAAAAILLLAALSLAACSTSLEEEYTEEQGHVSVTIGASNASRYVLPWEPDSPARQDYPLIHKVILSNGPDGAADQEKTIPSSGGTVDFRLAAGPWKIRVEGWLLSADSASGEDELKSIGQGDVTIAAGQNKEVTVTMKAPSAKVTVTFIVNGEVSITPPPPAQEVVPGTTINLPAIGGIYKTGHTFGGWNTKADGSGTPYAVGDSYTPTVITTFYAMWIPNQYNVTFINVDGTPVLPGVELDYGEKVTKPADPEKTGFSFGGWYKDSGFSALWNFTTDTVAGETPLYAKWTAIPYTVTFYDGAVVQSTVELNYGEKVTKPADPVKSGVAFGGWYRDNGTFYNPWNFTTDTVAGDTSLYAKWSNSQYSVSFDSKGGSGVNSVSVAPNSPIVRPSPDPTKDGFTFAGWYTDSAAISDPWDFATDTVTGDTPLYARWLSSGLFKKIAENNWDYISGVAANDLGAAITSVTSDTSGSGEYRFVMDENISVSSGLPALSRNKLTLISSVSASAGGTRTITQTGNNYLLTIYHSGPAGSSAELTLDDGITLIGNNANGHALVTVSGTDSKFFMKTGSKIIGNTNSSNPGGAVSVTGGTFTMEDGEISNNKANSSSAGAVFVGLNGTFNMTGGTIFNNESINGNGGGVYVDDGSFTLDGGTISGNTAYSGSGGGVYIGAGGTFNMRDGIIWNNLAVSKGGAVYLASGNFEMTGGTIGGSLGGNTADLGAGVYVYGGSFKLSDSAIISDNSAVSYGGGVFLEGGAFEMTGGTISGNEAHLYYGFGGGVYVDNSGSFTKQGGGTIYGNETGIDEALKNKAVDTNGHAVYINTPLGYRDTTAYADDDLDSSVPADWQH